MKQFLKYTLATILGIIVTFFVLILIFTAIVSIASKDKTKPVAANSILHLKLDYEIPEKTSDNPFESIDFQSFDTKPSLGLNDIVKSIDAAAADDNIKGIYFEMNDVGAGFSSVKVIRDAIEDFKESGKFVTSYGEFVSQKAYYLGSVADEVYLNPKGYVDFRGLGVQAMFLKGTLDKLDIDVEVFKTGSYKSAAEALTSDGFSDANRMQIKEMIDDVYDTFLEDIAESRNSTSQKLHSIADGMLAKLPSSAVANGIIDETKYYDQVYSMLKERSGVEEDEKLPLLSMSDYYANVKKSSDFAKDKIAVIFASGSIVDGEGDKNEVDSKRFAKIIKKVREDEKIKGVVLRVNSPGGSALASEVIWREIGLTKKQKPVVVSMGDVAASGGYYISCNADKIFAEPTTVTGSIGVIGVVPNMQAFFNSKLGITFDEIEMAEHSVFGGGAKPLSETEKAIIQESIDSIYITFKTRVSKGRNIAMNVVDTLAGGRIYSGEDALDHRLVDELGDMNDAIDEVVELTSLEKYRIVNYPKEKSPFEQIMKSLDSQASLKAKLKSELGEYYSFYETITTIKNRNPIQTRMYLDLVID